MTLSCDLEMPKNNTSGKILFSLELKYEFLQQKESRNAKIFENAIQKMYRPGKLKKKEEGTEN